MAKGRKKRNLKTFARLSSLRKSKSTNTETKYQIQRLALLSLLATIILYTVAEPIFRGNKHFFKGKNVINHL